MNQTAAGNAAHDHYDQAHELVDKAHKAGDPTVWRGFLDEAKVHLGLARLALELREVADTRAVVDK